MRYCLGVVALLLLSACGNKLTPQEKVARDERDIAMVEKANRGTAIPISPQPILFPDIKANDLFGIGCAFVAKGGGLTLRGSEKGIRLHRRDAGVGREAALAGQILAIQKAHAVDHAAARGLDLAGRVGVAVQLQRRMRQRDLQRAAFQPDQVAQCVGRGHQQPVEGQLRGGQCGAVGGVGVDRDEQRQRQRQPQQQAPAQRASGFILLHGSLGSGSPGRAAW